MPELPEVETIAATLAPQVTGRYIRQCRVLSPKSLECGLELLPVLVGGRVTDVRRRAKLLFMDIIDAQGVPLLAAFHFKMTGKLFVHPPGTDPQKHTKIIFDLAEAPEQEVCGRLFFDDMRTFGYCRLMRPQSLPEWSFWGKLGIEPLEALPEEMAVRLASCKGSIKAALLDQEIIVGIGNIYADESLFRAGIRPDAKSCSISLERLTELGRQVGLILREAIEACGSSIRDYRDANGNAGAFQNNFRAYGRGGKPCVICERSLIKTRVAGRGTAFCEHCQTY